MAKGLKEGERVRVRSCHEEDPFGPVTVRGCPAVVTRNWYGMVHLRVLAQVRNPIRNGTTTYRDELRELRVHARVLNRSGWTEEEELRWALARLE